MLVLARFRNHQLRQQLEALQPATSEPRDGIVCSPTATLEQQRRRARRALKIARAAEAIQQQAVIVVGAASA